MNRILLVVVLSLSSLITQAKLVQFTVDMKGVALDPSGLFVMGDFQSIKGLGADFDPGICQMLQDAVDTNLYHYTIDLPAFQKYEYLYCNAHLAYGVEFVPLESRASDISDYRWIYVDSLSSDTLKIAPIKFSDNHPEGKLLMRFKVDMSNETIPTTGVHVAGDFQGNNPATSRMYSFANNIYELILYADTNSHSFKYYNGNTQSQAELVPATCATNGNRTLNLNTDLVLQTVCFSACTACAPASSNELLSNNTIHVWPNPSNERFTVTLPQAAQSRFTLSTVSGAQLLSWTTTDKQFTIHRNDLPVGIYILQVEQDGHTYHQKILFQ